MELEKLQGPPRHPEIPQASWTPASSEQTWENWGGECKYVWFMHQWTKSDAHNEACLALCLNAPFGYGCKQWPYFEHDSHNGNHRGKQPFYEAASLKQANILD